MANEENSLTVKLSALGDTFQSGIGDALGTWTDFTKQLSKGPASMAAIATAGVAVAGALFGLAKSTADIGDRFQDLHEKTGMSVESLSLLDYAAVMSNTSLESIAAGAKFLSKNLEEAASGNKKAATTFKALGVNVDELLKLPIEERMLAMADAVSGVEDPGLRSTLAMEAMGKSAGELLPFMKDGADGIRQFMDEADAMGKKMSGETARQSAEFNDALDRLWVVIKQIGIDIGSVLIPPLTWLFDVISSVVGLIKNVFFASLHALNGMILALAAGLLKLIEGFTWFTDTLGLTNGAQKKVAEWQNTIDLMMIEAGKSAATSFNMAIVAVTGTAHAQEGLNKTVKDNIKLTDEQRRAIMAEEEAQKKAKETADAAAKARKEWLKASEQSVRDYLDSLDVMLDYKKTIKEFDDEYFEAYSNKIRMQGKTEKQVAEMVTAEKKRLKAGELQTVITVTALEEQAVKGVAASIKLLWNDSQTSFSDAWKNALNVFVDVLAQMVVQAMIAGKAIQMEMAAATAGITLLIGLIASVFSGGKGGNSAIRQATEDFLRAIRQTLKQFENEVLTTLQKLTRGSQNLLESFKVVQSLITIGWPARVVGENWKAILSVMGNMKDLIMERYELEKGLIKDVMDLLSQQKDFVLDIDRAISSVTRSTYGKEDLLGAQKQDIAMLLTLISGAMGQEKVDFARELQSAYLAYFETAKGLFSGADLAAIQAEVVAGLEQTKGFGVSGYDQLIDINLEMLGVQRTGADLQTQMVALLTTVQGAVQTSLTTLENIVTHIDRWGIYSDNAYLASQIANLSAALSSLGIDIPKMAVGGIVTKPTLAMIGESGSEAVIPLSKLGGMGGGTQNFNIALNLNSLGDLTVSRAKDLLRGVFGQAARELGKENVSWGMQPRSGATSF